MRVAVIGAGAIGAVLAAAAAGSGHEVTVCVRTPIDSLIVERDEESFALPVALATEPAAMTPNDVVVVAVKAIDNASVAPWLGALCEADTLVLSAQNGLDHAAHLGPFVPAGRVVPALAYIAAERLGPGRVRHLAGNRLVVPEDSVDAVDAVVGAGGLVVRGTADIRTAAWRKLMGNLVANPITALTMRRIGVMREPGIAALARGLLLEALQVGRAEGALLRDSDVEAIVTGTAQYGEDTGSSMLYDRLAGRPMEHEFLTGEVVRRGESRGIPVPLNSAMLALLEAADRGLSR